MRYEVSKQEHVFWSIQGRNYLKEDTRAFERPREQICDRVAELSDAVVLCAQAFLHVPFFLHNDGSLGFSKDTSTVTEKYCEIYGL